MKYKYLSGMILFCILIISNVATAKVTKDDYARADSVMKLNDLVYHGSVSGSWIEETPNYWYSVKTEKGKEYFMVDAAKLKKLPAFDQEKLCNQLNGQTGEHYKPFDLPLAKLKFNKELKEITFEAKKAKWSCDLKKYKLTKLEDLKPHEEETYWGESPDQMGNDPVLSPDSTKTAFIRDFNLFVEDNKTKKETQLSFNGSAGDLYSSYLVWSPNSEYIATYQVRLHEKTFFYIIESSPKDQLQPKLHKKEYVKPGDALPIHKPTLFNVKEKRQIPLNTQFYENQFEVSAPHWCADNRGFTFEFNQRGHQVYQVVFVDAGTGELKVLVNETSPTFIDYSGKHYRNDVNDGEEIIWASERDGWNHLYLIDGKTGEVKNQITKGNWLVRGVEKVDEKNRTIIFQAAGMNADEDPYFIHYCKINFDGSGFTDLTPEKMNHDATFSSDYTYFVDTYSTVDIPPTTVLRSTNDGKVLMTLEKADISELKNRNWIAPEVFVAKARDGKTDIWGNIYRPSNFDPAKSYPIVEYIYAGPQGSFAQKSFRAASYAFSGLSELGFVVVQMDGMGTSNRSKAFHDVCFKNIKDAGFPDRILWMKAAAEKYPYMDTSRVGIFGGSAGGQNSTTAVLLHPEFYDVAVSSCGCHDNRMDKMWWNEQWMGYPVGPEYSECSNVVNAHKLQGSLMLIVGEMDDNVDPASTMQVADALIKANKNFELVVLPGVKHTLGGDFGERKRRDFFVKHLLGDSTPEWNSK